MPSPTELLGQVAAALNACQEAGVKLRLRQGIVTARGPKFEGYVIDFHDGWTAVTRTPSDGSPPPEADEDGVD